MEILIDMNVLRSLKSENHIFSIWYLYVCCQHNPKTNYSRNIKFGILHLYHIQMLLEAFYKDRKKLCVQRHTKEFSVYRGTQKNSNTLRPMEEVSCCWIFAHLECTKNNKNNMYFCHTQKHVNNRIVYEWHS